MTKVQLCRECHVLPVTYADEEMCDLCYIEIFEGYEGEEPVDIRLKGSKGRRMTEGFQILREREGNC
jgi:hypothetical protein